MGTLSKTVRAVLAAHGGVCSTEELLKSIEADPSAAQLLKQGKGLCPCKHEAWRLRDSRMRVREANEQALRPRKNRITEHRTSPLPAGCW